MEIYLLLGEVLDTKKGLDSGYTSFEAEEKKLRATENKARMKG